MDTSLAQDSMLLTLNRFPQAVHFGTFQMCSSLLTLQAKRRTDDTTDLICENLRRFFANQPLFNIVDKNLGFPHPNVLYKPTN